MTGAAALLGASSSTSPVGGEDLAMKQASSTAVSGATTCGASSSSCTTHGSSQQRNSNGKAGAAAPPVAGAAGAAGPMVLTLAPGEAIPQGYKACSKCKVVKLAAANFWKDPTKKNGYTSWCKACFSKCAERRKAEGPMHVTERECSICHIRKPADAFMKDARRITGLDARCRECRRQQHAARKRRNLEQQQGVQMWDEKECKRCHVVKPAAMFKKHAYTASGLDSWCKACCSERRKELLAQRALEHAQHLAAKDVRECIACLRFKPACDYPRDGAQPDGVAKRCKACEERAFAGAPLATAAAAPAASLPTHPPPPLPPMPPPSHPSLPLPLPGGGASAGVGSAAGSLTPRGLPISPLLATLPELPPYMGEPVTTMAVQLATLAASRLSSGAGAPPPPATSSFPGTPSHAGHLPGGGGSSAVLSGSTAGGANSRAVSGAGIDFLMRSGGMSAGGAMPQQLSSSVGALNSGSPANNGNGLFHGVVPPVASLSSPLPLLSGTSPFGQDQQQQQHLQRLSMSQQLYGGWGAGGNGGNANTVLPPAPPLLSGTAPSYAVPPPPQLQGSQQQQQQAGGFGASPFTGVSALPGMGQDLHELLGLAPTTPTTPGHPSHNYSSSVNLSATPSSAAMSQQASAAAASMAAATAAAMAMAGLPSSASMMMAGGGGGGFTAQQQQQMMAAAHHAASLPSPATAAALFGSCTGMAGVTMQAGLHGGSVASAGGHHLLGAGGSSSVAAGSGRVPSAFLTGADPSLVAALGATMAKRESNNGGFGLLGTSPSAQQAAALGTTLSQGQQQQQQQQTGMDGVATANASNNNGSSAAAGELPELAKGATTGAMDVSTAAAVSAAAMGTMNGLSLAAGAATTTNASGAPRPASPLTAFTALNGHTLLQHNQHQQHQQQMQQATAAAMASSGALAGATTTRAGNRRVESLLGGLGGVFDAHAADGYDPTRMRTDSAGSLRELREESFRALLEATRHETLFGGGLAPPVQRISSLLGCGSLGSVLGSGSCLGSGTCGPMSFDGAPLALPMSNAGMGSQNGHHHHHTSGPSRLSQMTASQLQQQQQQLAASLPAAGSSMARLGGVLSGGGKTLPQASGGRGGLASQQQQDQQQQPSLLDGMTRVESLFGGVDLERAMSLAAAEVSDVSPSLADAMQALESAGDVQAQQALPVGAGM